MKPMLLNNIAFLLIIYFLGSIFLYTWKVHVLYHLKIAYIYIYIREIKINKKNNMLINYW